MARDLPPRSDTPAASFARAIACLLLIAFVAGGVFIVERGLGDWRRELSTRRWSVVPCTIIQSRIEPRGKWGAGPYQWQGAYNYQWHGKSHTSTRFALSHQPSYDYASEERLWLKYPQGARTTCWVNPSDPSRAVLEHDAAYSWIAIVFGLAVGILPAAGIGFMLRRRARASRTSDRAPQTRMVPSPIANARRTRAGGAFFSLLFVVGGAALLWFTSLRPALRARTAATSWRRAPCTIVNSAVAEHPGSGEDNQPSYSVDLLYEYAIEDRQYRANRFDFAADPESDDDPQLAIARKFPGGSRTYCYVNPADPLDAVLQPGAGPHAWIGAIIGMVFLAIGVAGSIGVHRSYRSAAMPSGPFGLPRSSNHPIRLKSLQRPLINFVLFLINAILCSGGFVLMLRRTIAGTYGHRGALLVVMVFLLVLLAAASSILIFIVMCGILLLFDPRVVLTLSRGAIEVGGSDEIRWRFAGRNDRIKRFTLHLEAWEEASYSDGDSTHTDERLLMKIPIYETERADQIEQGACVLHVPRGALHTFRAAHNVIRWIIAARGQLPRGQELKNRFELPVLPSPVTFTVPATRAGAPAETKPLDRASSVRIAIVGGRTAFAPGEVISGTAACPRQSQPANVVVRLFWFTRGRGTSDMQIVEEVSVSNTQGLGEMPFSLRVPNGPYSFSGRLISIVWGIEAMDELSGKSGKIEIVCAPEGREIAPNPVQPESSPSSIPATA